MKTVMFYLCVACAFLYMAAAVYLIQAGLSGLHAVIMAAYFLGCAWLLGQPEGSPPTRPAT